ncbi:MAG: 1,4-alpha-glucan branching protein GlgB, partial [Candidatus Omnitrophica bacterium]|nr:1,4-alpha-glucan branching protein GlgB [Candidatus Omnitrophota bacterium]
FKILGPHVFKEERCVVVRAFLPRATQAWIRLSKKKSVRTPMRKIHPNGLFQAVFERTSKINPYKLGFFDETGFEQESEDPYAFPPEVSDFDLYLIGEGTHYHSYEKLGARPMLLKGVSGVYFVVWSPNAKSVSVVGNFNHWMTGTHPMAKIRYSGVWGLFIPGLTEGEVYKYAIKSEVDGQIRLKTDPYAFSAELRPNSASVVARLDAYAWQDQMWMESRMQKDLFESPVSIYEVHLGSWKRDGQKNWGFLNYRDLAYELVEYVKFMGYTHIELMPVMEHPLDESWGYQVINYYAPTSRFGTPAEFMYFIDYCHQNVIGVILDWVPSHFPRDGHGLVDFDGRQIYAYESWRKGEHREWGTLVFDFGKREVSNFLISNALFWLDQYHVDGLRVDAVASMLYLDYARKPGEWEPNVYGGHENLEAVAFLKKFNEVVHARFPGVLTIAEESTAWGGVSRPTYTGGLGFSMKWNMGWMHDVLEYFSKDPVYRKYHQGMLTFSMWYAYSENFILPISHDEVVHGKRALLEKMPGDDWQKFSNLRVFLAYLFAHPGKKLLFMGSEFAQRSEWNVQQSLDWHFLQYAPHTRINLLLRDLHRIYRENPALYEGDFRSECFEWIDFSDVDSSVISFLRWSRHYNQLLVFVFNMTPVIRENYRVGVPRYGYYQEIFNSQGREYGGCGLGNCGGLHSDSVAWQGRPFSLNLHLPPLSACIFRHC